MVLCHRLMAQPGYPWALELEVRYRLCGAGLVVTQSATNRGESAAPYASGAHPYLTAGAGPADGRTWVHLHGEHAVSLWADARHGCLQLFTADDVGEASRRSLAVEPMTAPADAFRSGDGLTVRAPGERFEASWGVTACG